MGTPIGIQNQQTKIDGIRLSPAMFPIRIGYEEKKEKDFVLQKKQVPAIFLICIAHREQLSSRPSTASSSPGGAGSSDSTSPPSSCARPCCRPPPPDLRPTSPSSTSHVDLRRGGAEEAKGPPPVLDLPGRRSAGPGSAGAEADAAAGGG
jgi:hypothetical protein